jgi:hypothetical protein
MPSSTPDRYSFRSEFGFHGNSCSDGAGFKKRALANITAITVILILSIASGSHPAESAAATLGFTYTHIKTNCPQNGPVDEETLANRRGHKSQAVDPADNIILHYNEPDVQTKVDATLKYMRSTASALRLVFWVNSDDTQDTKPRRDHLGIAMTNGDTLPRDALLNLAAILNKADALGYSKAYVVIGNQGDSGPRCRNVDYGDCFDPAKSLAPDWAMRKSIIDTVQAQGPKRMPVYFDISPESCPGGAATPQMRTILTQFTTYMVQQYTKTYSDNRFFVSCHGKPLDRAISGLDEMVGLYKSLGVRPHSLDVHMYTTDSQLASAVLSRAAQDAQSLGVALDVLETNYDGQPVFSAISALRKSGKLSPLETVAVWPKTHDSMCAFSIQWPLDLGKVATDVGN